MTLALPSWYYARLRLVVDSTGPAQEGHGQPWPLPSKWTLASAVQNHASFRGKFDTSTATLARSPMCARPALPWGTAPHRPHRLRWSRPPRVSASPCPLRRSASPTESPAAHPTAPPPESPVWVALCRSLRVSPQPSARKCACDREVWVSVRNRQCARERLCAPRTEKRVRLFVGERACAHIHACVRACKRLRACACV